MKAKSETNHLEQKEGSAVSSYTVNGRKFLVEPVFKGEPGETLGEILLKLIKNDVEKH